MKTTTASSNIRPLNKRNFSELESTFRIQQRAYEIEAKILNAKSFPPLNETIDDLKNSKDEVFVAVVDSVIVGAICLEENESYKLVSKLVVDPDFFRKGHARALVQHVLGLYPGVEFQVGTGAANEPALSLYKSLGFRILSQQMVEGNLRVVKLKRPAIISIQGKFLESHRTTQELIREYMLVYNHNLKFKEGDPQEDLLLLAEGLLVFTVLERFLRIIPAIKSQPGETLYPMLERAIKSELGLFRLTSEKQSQLLIEIKNFRNALLHGNYEQAAAQADKKTPEEYFRSVYAARLQVMHDLVDTLIRRIDLDSGEIISLA